jgi:long-chain acyl-CoA synthetase
VRTSRGSPPTRPACRRGSRRRPTVCSARSRRTWRRESRRPGHLPIMPNGMAASLSFAQVNRYSDAFAAYLRETLRLEPGARVAIQIPNGLAYPVAAFGIFKAGCVLVNVNPLYTAHEMAHVFADAEPSAIVAIDIFAGKLAVAMEQVPVPHVILTEAATLFPMPSRRLIGFVQKYVKKQVPIRISVMPFFRKRLRWARPTFAQGPMSRATRGGWNPLPSRVCNIPAAPRG